MAALDADESWDCLDEWDSELVPTFACIEDLHNRLIAARQGVSA